MRRIAGLRRQRRGWRQSDITLGGTLKAVRRAREGVKVNNSRKLHERLSSDIVLGAPVSGEPALGAPVSGGLASGAPVSGEPGSHAVCLSSSLILK